MPQWGYLDASGKLVIDFQFDHASQFNEGFALVLIGEEGGFIDRAGRMRIPPQFGPESQVFCEDLAMVQARSGKCGYLTKTGQFAIEPSFDWAGCFCEGLAFVRQNQLYGYINKDGQQIVTPKYDIAGDFSEGLALVRDKKDSSYIDTKGTPVSHLQHGDDEFREGVARAWIKGTNALLLRSGRHILLPGINWMSAYCSGALIQIKVDKKYGFINREGETVIQPQFDEASTFSEGMAAIRIGTKWGYVDVTGRMIIKPQFENAESFSEGLALVKVKGSAAFINTAGEVVFRTPYSAGFPFREGLTPVYIDES